MYDGAIRKISVFDLDKIVELERKCFDRYIAYTPKQLKYLITRANSSCLAETIQDTIRGFIIVLYRKGAVVAGIETLNIDPLFQGKGIGKKLLNAAEIDVIPRSIRKIRLEVATSNLPALKLYQRSGFRITALLKNYYNFEHNGTRDAFRMVKELTT